MKFVYELGGEVTMQEQNAGAVYHLPYIHLPYVRTLPEESCVSVLWAEPLTTEAFVPAPWFGFTAYSKPKKTPWWKVLISMLKSLLGRT